MLQNSEISLLAQPARISKMIPCFAHKVGDSAVSDFVSRGSRGYYKLKLRTNIVRIMREPQLITDGMMYFKTPRLTAIPDILIFRAPMQCGV